MKQPKAQNWRKFQKLKVRGQHLSTRAKKVEAATVRHAHEFIVGRWRNAREVRRNIGLWLLGVGVLVAMVAVQFLLLRATYAEDAPVSGGMYAEGVVGEIDTLNPLYATTPAEQSASRLLFSTLFSYDSTGSLKGDIAKKYTIDESGKTYTVTLKDDVRWHDGTPLTAADVAFTASLLKKPATGSPLSASWQDIEVKKVTDTTVQFTLPAAYVPFPHALTFAVLPEHILKEVPPNMLREHSFSQEPIGSGPMALRFMQRVKDGASGHAVVHLKRNELYHSGVTRISRMQLHAFENYDELVKGVRSRSINAANGSSINKLMSFSDDERYNVNVAPVQAGVFALFNTQSDLLQDKEVRRALVRGTDVVKALTDLKWSPHKIDSPFTSGQVKLTDREAKPALDSKKAQQMLEASGWIANEKGLRFKDNRPLQLRLVYIKDADYEIVVANLAKQWRMLGVEVSTQPIDINDPTQNFASNVLQPRDYDVLVHELAIGADPDVYAYWHSSQAVARGLNFTNYKDDISDDALTGARMQQDPYLRELKYQSFVRRWQAEAPAIGLYQSATAYISTRATQNIPKNIRMVTAEDRYTNIQEWTARQDAVYKTP